MTETNEEPCLAKIGKNWERADFIGIFQYPVAVVRFGGKLHQVDISNVDFCEVTD